MLSLYVQKTVNTEEAGKQKGTKELSRAVTFEIKNGLDMLKREEGLRLPFRVVKGADGNVRTVLFDMEHRVNDALKIAAKPKLTSEDKQALGKLRDDFVSLVKELQHINNELSANAPGTFLVPLGRIEKAKPTERLTLGGYFDQKRFKLPNKQKAAILQSMDVFIK